MEYKALKDIANITMGHSPESSSYNKDGDGLPFYQGNADFGEMYPNERMWCNAPKKMAEPKDILISVRAPIGALNYAKDKCCIGRGLAAITVEDDAERNYIYHYLKAKNADLNKQGTGSTFKAISKSILEELKVPQITQAEKQKCMDLMDLLESVIRERKKQLATLDRLIRARFVEMFGEEKNMMVMSDICSIITDGTHQPPKFKNEGIPFIFVSNITGDRVTYETEKYIDQNTYDELIKRTPIEIGDVLLSTVGSYGHPAVVKSDKKFLFQRHIAYMKPRKELIDSDYLHGAILSPDAQRQIESGVKGIAQKTLNLSEIKKMTIPVPPLSRQKEFSYFVAQVDKSKVAVKKALDETQLLFDSLMQKYFG